MVASLCLGCLVTFNMRKQTNFESVDKLDTDKYFKQNLKHHLGPKKILFRIFEVLM